MTADQALVTPHVSISLDECAEGAFEIEELTFNPFVDDGREPRAEVWVEFLIRRQRSGDEEVLAVPSVVLEFSERALSRNPTCDYPSPGVKADSHSPSRDMNFIMHTDIWYSFVRSGDVDREFMTRGYRHPVRLLYLCEHCAGHRDAPCVETRTWKTAGHAFFEDSHFKSSASRLLQDLTHFGEIMSALPEKHVEEVESVDGVQKSLKLFRLKDARRFAPVLFEEGQRRSEYRFGVRRLPWAVDESDRAATETASLYEPSFGGTAGIKRDFRGWVLAPKLFCVKTNEHVVAKLRQGEGVRFWVRWRSVASIRRHTKRSRISFSHSIHVQAPLKYFNTFLRMPPGFRHLPGGLTPYRNYSVPPRLFMFWNQQGSDQCLSHSESFSGDPAYLELGVEFENVEYERRQIVKLFVLAFATNAVLALGIQNVYSQQTAPRFLQFFEVSWGCGAALLPLLLGTAWVYRGRDLRLGWFLLVVAVCAALPSTAGALEGASLRFLLLFVAVVLSVVATGLFSFRRLGSVAMSILRLLGLLKLWRLFDQRLFLRNVDLTCLEEGE